MKRTILLIVYLVAQTIFGQTATAPSAGNGSSGDPYQIASLENLYWIAENTGRWGFHYKQTADIDASSTSGWFSNQGWDKIGNSSTKFTGSYDGQGFKIDGLYINRNTSTQGLFGFTNGAEIKNLGLTNVNITGTSQVGGLSGEAQSTPITNCYVTGNVNGSTSDGQTSVGGMIGILGSSSTLRSSYADVTVSGRFQVGGLVGYLNYATITNSYSKGSVTGTSLYIGGIAGNINSSCKIDSSYSNANVSGQSYVGGAVGNMTGGSCEVYRTYATGNVSSTSGSAGGFVGYMWNSGDIISNCYSLGNVSRTIGSDVSYGGFGGYLQAGTISSCYSKGSVNFGTTKGFLGGSSVSTYSANFFDSQASGQTSGTGATAKTTAEMKTNTTFLNAGWNSSVWFMDEGFNSGYPYLSWQSPGGTPLPVELINFVAQLLGETIILNWQTASEVNNYGFEIERASFRKNETTPLQEWEKIGFVEGHGNCNSPKEYSFTDNSTLSGKLKYRLKQIDTDGSFSYSEIVEVEKENIPTEFALYQNYPNPFNPTTKIEFSIPTDNNVELKVYNVLGMEVTTLIDEHRQAGMHNVEFNASNLSSGVYFYKVVSGNNSETKKMMLVR